MDKENKYAKSSRAFIDACECLPGGVNSPVRAFGGVDESPIFIESASGAKIRDIDGNEYIDYVGSWGPMIVGHGHPAVLKAVTEYAVQTFNLRRVYALPYAWNEASFRVLEKAGYVLEGRLRCSAFKDGSWVDQMMYAYVVAP